MLTNALSPTDRASALACGDRMRNALALVAEGTPHRDSARDVGYRDRREVWACSTCTASRSWLPKSGSRRARTPSSSARAIIGGIAADKAAKYENAEG